MKISVIIPTLQEEGLIGPLVQHLFKASEAFLEEVIVADGGSLDTTVSTDEAAGATLVTCSQASRAGQMNAGARMAKGQIIHFIHADAWPPAGFDAHVVQAVTKSQPCGCYRSRFQISSKFLLLNSYWTRSQRLLFRGGGQTLFVDRNLFWEEGGFDAQLAVMEEYDFIRRLIKHSRFKVLPKEVLVSPRKYEQNGNVRLQFAYGLVMLLFFLGSPQQRLMQVYKFLIK